MIQRIQSVFFLIGAVLAIVYVKMPSIQINELIHNALEFLPVSIFAMAAGLILIITIFLFKNRLLQINFARLALLLLIVTIGVSLYYEFTDNTFSPSWGAVFPLIAAIFCLLGIRGIRNDEKLVRSMDRLR